MSYHVTDYLDARINLFGSSFVGSADRASSGPIAKLRAWQKKRRALRELAALDDRLLADIGLDRATIRPVVEGLVDRVQTGGTAANDNTAARAA